MINQIRKSKTRITSTLQYSRPAEGQGTYPIYSQSPGHIDKPKNPRLKEKAKLIYKKMCSNLWKHKQLKRHSKNEQRKFEHSITFPHFCVAAAISFDVLLEIRVMYSKTKNRTGFPSLFSVCFTSNSLQKRLSSQMHTYTPSNKPPKLHFRP